MKKNILNSTITLSALFFLSGCYTVLWMPEDKFPSQITTNEYYDETYYGDYYGFYDYPWWLNLVPPSTPVGSDYIRTKNETTTSIRNEGEGRGTDTRRPILITDPPSRDASNNNNSSNNNSNSKNSSNNNNSSSVNSNNSSSSRSSDNNSIRNNDGNRNTNSGRK